jgi:cell division septation protein DedD
VGASPAVDDLSYFNRLQGANPTPEQLKAPAPAQPAPPAAAPAPSSAPAPPAAAPARADVAATNNSPSRAGFTVQIAALNVRSEADAIAERLASKGYAAYVLSPASGTPQIYRVRIGKFGSRREAETMAAKLESEEQFKPWVTR